MLEESSAIEVMGLKECSVEIAKRNIDALKHCVSEFRACSFRYPEGDSFRSIYSSLESIFESYETAFELIMLFEEAELQRPLSRLLEEALEKMRSKIECVAEH